MSDLVKKIISVFLLQSYIIMLVPAKELVQQFNDSQFFERQVTNQSFSTFENEENMYNEIVENLTDEQFVCDQTFWSDDELIKNFNKLNANIENSSSSKNANSIFLIHKSELYKRLKSAKENFYFKNQDELTRKIDVTQTEEVKQQWNKIVDKIIADYLQEVNIASINSTQIKEDFFKMEKEIYNSLLNELLYDQFSLRKESDKDSAMIVANQLATEVETTTNQSFDKLFNQINIKSQDVNVNDISVTPENWLNDFSKQIELGIEKWNQVEKEFLELRFTWENSAQESFQNDLATWTDAYDELLKRRDKWNSEINQKIEEGMSLWNQKEQKLFAQLSQLEENTQNELYEQFEQKKQYLLANQQMYSQTRSLLASTQKNIYSWAEKWTEKYNGIYSYWKVESDKQKAEIEKEKQNAKKYNQRFDESKWQIIQVEENPLINIFEVAISDVNQAKQIIKNVKTKIVTTLQIFVPPTKKFFYSVEQKKYDCNSSAEDIKELINDINDQNKILDSNLITLLDSNNILWTNLDILENWLNVYNENSNSLINYKNSILQLLGYSNDKNLNIEFTELNSELIQQSQIEQYWKEQVQIAQYVYDYTLDETSFVDTLEDTEQKLEQAERNYQVANSEYEEQVNKLNLAEANYLASKEDYQAQQDKVNELLIELESAQNNYNSLKSNVTAIELKKLKENVLSNIDSLNLLSFNSYENQKNLDSYYENLEFVEYENIATRGLEFIDTITQGQVVEFNQIDDDLYEATKLEYEKTLTESEKELIKEEKVDVLSIEELEIIIEDKKNNNEDFSNELKTLVNKKAQIEFIKTGEVKEFLTEDIDLEQIQKELKNYSVLYQKKIDDETKKLIAEIILTEQEKNPAYYLLMTDLEIENFFTKIDSIATENDCSEFIKTQISLYKNQIIKARSEKSKDTVYTKIEDTFKDSFINKKNFFIENYASIFSNIKLDEDFLFEMGQEKNQDSDYIDNKESIESVDIQSVLNNLFLDEQSYDKVFLLLSKNIDLYLDKNSFFDSYNQDIEELQKQIEKLESEYKAQIDLLNQNNTKNYYSEMLKSFDLYDKQLKQVQFFYDDVKAKKLELESAQELYTWAENQYLHLNYNSIDVFDPLEKLDFANSRYQQCLQNRIKLEQLLESNSQDCILEIFDDDGKDLVLDYQTKFEYKQKAKVLKEEFSVLLQTYKNELYDSQIYLYNSIYDLVNFDQMQTVIDAEKNGKDINEEDKFVIPEDVKKLVIIEKALENDNQSYKITLNNLIKKVTERIVEEPIESAENDNSFNSNVKTKKRKETVITYETDEEDADLKNDIIDYLSDRQITECDIYGNEHLFSISSKDCIDFLTSFSSKTYSINDVMLASCYLKTLVQDEKLFFENENPEDDINYPFNIPKESIYGIPLKPEYKSGRLKQIKEAYEKVINNNGSDDIAKFLVYSSYCVNDSFDFEEYEKNLIASLGFDFVINRLSSEASECSQRAAIYLGSAAVMTPLLWCCGWLVVPQIALLAMSATYFSNADAIREVNSDVKRLKDNYFQIVSEFDNLYNSNLSTYINAKENRDTLEKRYYQALFGTETVSDSVLTFENFNFALKNIFDKENQTSIKYSFFENLKDISKDKSSFEDLFYTVTKDKECKDVMTAIEYIYEYLDTIEKEAFATLENAANQKRLNHNIAKQELSVEKIQLLNYEKVNEDNFDTSHFEKLYEELFSENSWNEELYQKKLLSIRSNFFANAPVLFSRNVEDYISDNFEECFPIYENLLDDSYSNVLMQEMNSNNIIVQDFYHKFDQWKTQMGFILNVADSEWKKAEQMLNNDFNLWQKSWTQKYEESDNQWNSEYKNLLVQKNDWINTQYVTGALSGTIDNFDQAEFEQKSIEVKTKAKQLVLENSNQLSSFSLPENFSQNYLNSIYDSTLFNFLNDFSFGLNNNINDFAINKIQSQVNSFNNFLQQDKISSAIKSLETQMKKEASLYASQIAQEQVYDTIDNIYNMIEEQNLNMEKWEFDFVRKDGYSVGNEISRDAIVDSTVTQNVIRERQTVHKYEWFNCAYPLLAYNLTNFSYLDSDSIELLMSENFSQINQWYKDIFGEQSKSNEDKKSNAEKGEFQKHIGEGPVFVDNPDVKKSREENIKENGSGQLGFILSDYIWNSYLHTEGYTALGTPLYDKKITRDNKILGIELPTLRDITEIVCDIVSNATGQMWLSYADDLLYGALDIQLGQKTVGDVFGAFAKKELTTYISNGIGSMAKGITKGINSLESAFEKTVLNGLTQAGSSYLNGVVSEQLNAIDFSKGFDIDWDKINSAWTSKNVITSAVGSGISYYASTFTNSKLNQVFLQDNLKMNLSNAVFNVDGISRLTQTASSIAGGFAQMAVTGNAQFNILNSRDLGIASNTGGVGIFAINFNRNGDVSGKFTTSGISLDLKSVVKDVANGALKESFKIASAKVKNSLGQKEDITTINAINALGFSGAEKNIKVAKDILNDKAKVIYDKDLKSETGETILGFFDSEKSNEIHLNASLIGDTKESTVNLATVLSHEGTHYQGNRIEGVAHALGYYTYYALSEIYQTQKDTALVNDMKKAINDKNNWEANDGTVDYWRFYYDGRIEDDGTNYISVETTAGGGKQQFTIISNFTGSKAEALVNVLGIDYVKKLLGKNFDSIDDFSDDAIMSVTGLPKETIKMVKIHGVDYLKNNPEIFNKLVGNQLLLETGHDYVNGKWQEIKELKDNATSKLKINGLKAGENLAMRKTSDNKYEFYTVNAYLYRKEGAFEPFEVKDGKVGDLKPEDVANSFLLFEKRNLMTNQNDYLVYKGTLSTIDKLSDDETVFVDGKEYKGNTIVSRGFNLRFNEATVNNKNLYNINTVGIFSNADTLNGTHIYEYGSSDPYNLRWLLHSTDAAAGSMGCFLTVKEIYANGPWNDVNVVGSGVYNYEKLRYELKEFGVYDQYQMKGILFGQLTPNTYESGKSDIEKKIQSLAESKKNISSLNTFVPKEPFDPSKVKMPHEPGQKKN